MMNSNHQVKSKKYNSPKEYYPLYLTEHQNSINRVLHFTGIALLCLCFVASMLFHNVNFFIAMPFVAYGFAFIGHQFFERNKPSTLKHPFLTIACDFLFFGDVVMGRQTFRVK